MEEQMGLNAFRDETARFTASLGASALSEAELVRELDHEMKRLRACIRRDRASLQHAVCDVLFLLFSIAAERELDLDSEWQQGREGKQQKYLRDAANAERPRET